MKGTSCFLLMGFVLIAAGPLFAQNSVPEIPYDSAANFLKLPDNLYLGEAAGVATNSKGHVFVYTRSGSPTVTIGTNRTFARSSARLFEFDQTGKYVREIGQGLYGFVFAHAVRVDRQDNIWVIDEGSNMIIKFDPEGRLLMTLGRKPEALTVPAPSGAAEGGRGGGRGGLPGAGIPGDNFNRPTDVAWDSAGSIFVADGYGNSRIAKFDKYGKFIKSWGSRGTEPGQFNLPHTIAVDSQNNVYVGDRENKRIQVFDSDGNFKTQYTNVGAPYAICITPGPRQFLYTSNSNPSTSMDNGEIYKMSLDGKVLGKFGTAGKLLKEFGTIHEMDCRSENEIYVGELTNWRVQKLTLRPAQSN
ncbi:MAG TPA: peptidyl-alpha-hydroxyglycine alpha-amidating lyase family protein [Terriglobia bacterium]|nr:peptidyl-alpha-hydroxyglycine alpha-amidating lyase family protein [Terriglobia bacterium]